MGIRFKTTQKTAKLGRFNHENLLEKNICKYERDFIHLKNIGIIYVLKIILKFFLFVKDSQRKF